jgi:hypothetical protein
LQTNNRCVPGRYLAIAKSYSAGSLKLAGIIMRDGNSDDIISATVTSSINCGRNFSIHRWWQYLENYCNTNKI